MANWENVIAAAKDFAVNTGRKMTNMADVVAIKMELSEKEHALSDVMEALGHLLYDSRKENFDLNEELISELISQAEPAPMIYWRLILWPGLAIFLSVCAFNFVGEGIRKAIN